MEDFRTTDAEIRLLYDSETFIILLIITHTVNFSRKKCNLFLFYEILAEKLSAIAIGKPYAYKEITIADSVLQTYAGVYENENGDQFVISVSGGRLYSQRGRGPEVQVKAFKKEHFFFDDPMITMEFPGNKSGKAERLIIHSRTTNELWTRSDKPVLTQTELKVDQKILESYTGEYEVSPQFSFTVTNEKDRLFIQATGQPKLEMFSE